MRLRTKRRRAFTRELDKRQSKGIKKLNAWFGFDGGPMSQTGGSDDYDRKMNAKRRQENWPQ